MNIETMSLDDLLAAAESRAGEFVKEANDSSQEEETQIELPQVSDDLATTEILQKAASFKTEFSEENMNKSQAVLKGQALADQLLVKLASAGDVSSADGVAPGSTPNKAIVDNAAIVGEDNLRDQLQPGLGGSVNEIFDAVVADAAEQGVVLDETGNPVADLEGGGEDSATPNQVETYDSDEHEKAAAVASLVGEGIDFDQAVDMVKQASLELDQEEFEMEKIATINSLVAEGYSFEDAVAAVEYGDNELTKVATLNSLLEQGVEYDQAVELVKEASIGSRIAGAARAVKGVGVAAKRGIRSGATGSVVGQGGAAHTAGVKVGRGYGAVKGAVAGAANKVRTMGGYAKHGYNTAGTGITTSSSASLANRAAHGVGKGAGSAVQFAKSRPYTTAGIGAGVVAAGAGGTYAATRGREKQAAFEGLVNLGYDALTAAELVNQKAYELYGE